MQKKFAMLLISAAMLALPVQANAQSDSDLDLTLSRISVFIETNISKAFELIGAAKIQYPDNPKVLAAEAEANLHIGNPQRARILLERAHELDPGNEDITDQLHKVELLSKPFVAMDGDIRDTRNEAVEKMGRVLGESRISSNWAAGLNLEDDYIRTKPTLISNGTTQTFSEDRQQGEAYMRYDNDNGDQWKGSFYASNGTVGGGALYRMLEVSGWTQIEGNYRKPDWEDFITSVVDEGTKDNVKLSQFYRITEQFSANLSGALNRYNLQDKSDEASSYELIGGLMYDFNPDTVARILGKNSGFSLNYNVDAEYQMHVDSLIVGGVPVHPLPFNDHQIHSLTANASKQIGWDGLWHVEGYGGYAYDTLGDGGPLFGASLLYQPVDAFSFEIRAGQSILKEQTSEKVDEVGVNLKWKFL